MSLPEQHTRIMAADPIEVGDVRVLPSVLVNTSSQRWSGYGVSSRVRLRPVSVVVESPAGTRWHEIPNTESDAVSRMMAVAGGIAGISLLILVLARWMRRS
jgi:hypothetical protein